MLTKIALVLAIIASCECARILFLLPTVSRSHTLWHRPLINRLTDRHEITVATPFAKDVQHLPVKVLEFEDVYEQIWNDELHNIEQLSKQTMDNYDMFDKYCVETCHLIIPTTGFKQLNSTPPNTFDLIVLDILTAPHCFYPMLNHMGKTVPIIATLPYGYNDHGTVLMRDYMHPAITPSNDSPWSDRMTFWQRLRNFVKHLTMYHLYYTKTFPLLKRFTEEALNGGRVWDADEFYAVEERINVLLVNGDPFLTYPRPAAPDIIDVGGIHADVAKSRTVPLPEDIQEFVHRHKNGVVMFSLGSNHDTSDMTPSKIQAFANVFSELPYGVLWKSRTNLSEYQISDNVLIQPWLPISTILAQANVKLFITHGGLLSTQEALGNGVPTVGLPIFIDQIHNTKLIESKRAGLQLLQADVNEMNVRRAINEILRDKTYADNAKRISSLYMDQQVSALDKAQFWVEFSLKHGVVPELHLATRRLNVWQMYCLDVIASLVVVALLVVAVIVLGAIRLLACVTRRVKCKRD